MTNDERKAMLFEAADKGRKLYDDERGELKALLRSGTVNADEDARIRAAFPLDYEYATSFGSTASAVSRVERPANSNRGLIAVVVVIAMALFAGIAGLSGKSDNARPTQSQPTDSTADTAISEPVATDRPLSDMNLKTIGVSPHNTGENKNWACPATKEQFDAMTDALVKSDSEGYQESVADGVALEPGTKVRILDHTGMLGTVVKLRILSGPDEGRACYASADADGFFKEGYP